MDKFQKICIGAMTISVCLFLLTVPFMFVVSAIGRCS